MKVPSRGSDQFNLRFPDGMRDQIAVEAERNGRSMNAEIISRLEDTFVIDRHMRERAEQLGEAIPEPRRPRKTTTDEEILKEIQALREDFNRLNTKTFIEMVAKVGNHLADKQERNED